MEANLENKKRKLSKAQSIILDIALTIIFIPLAVMLFLGLLFHALSLTLEIVLIPSVIILAVLILIKK